MVDNVAVTVSKAAAKFEAIFEAKIRRRRALVLRFGTNHGLREWKYEADSLREELLTERQRFIDGTENSLKLDRESPEDIRNAHEIVYKLLGINEEIGNKSQLDSVFARDLWFPLTAGLLLNRNEQFAAAHEWYRLLYNPATGTAAEVFNRFSGDVIKERNASKWLKAPFDPIAIANRRQGVWLRYTIIAMVRNLVDWADDDFARALPDTYQRAEERYELAGKVLGAKALENDCEAAVLDVIHSIGKAFGMTKQEAARYAAPLMQVRSVKAMTEAKVRIEEELEQDSKKRKLASITKIIDNAKNRDQKQHPHKSLKAEWDDRFRRAMDAENKIFSQSKSGGPISPQPKPQPDLHRPLDDLFDGPINLPPSIISLEFCVPLNPVVNLLGKQIRTQLDKLNHCLDITGEPQMPRVYGCDTYDPATGLINRPTAILSQFTHATDQPRYRYSYLVEKARQYVDVAQRIGSLLLQSVQARDSEAFAQLKAAHAIEVAGATVELRRLGQIEASHGVEIAVLQSDRADRQVSFWKDRVGDPDDLYDDLSEEEADGLCNLQRGAELTRIGAIVTATVGPAMAAAGAVTTATGVGAPVGIPLMIAGVLLSAGQGMSALGSSNTTTGNALQASASFERRSEEWKNQFDLAQFDAQIAELQVNLADDREAIADQESVIAQLQLSHAREELRFLQTKTTNLALYDWMIRILSRDYRTLMQIAAGVAHMAQRSLEFERQEPVRFILGEYWNVATDVIEARNLTEKQRSLGLLGAERLLTDLTKLDAFRLTTEQRRQQISKTISLARMMPLELAGFRQSGVITFNTLMEWFDDDFQGQYLRLIKCVRVTVLALVPPVEGIHATLQNTGESSVVVTEYGGHNFSKKRALRNFGERVSLDAPFNESGLFVLNYEDPMLLPFEGLGVETQWTLELPRANNRFNLDTIADVMLTIEYTAEHSSIYERELRASRMGVDAQEDAAIPLRLQFPDAWYHLKNNRKDPSGVYSPFAFTFHLPRAIFAPNLEDSINVVHLTLLVSGNLSTAEQELVADGITITHQGVVLHKKNVPRPATAVASATTIVSTSALGNPVFGENAILLSTRGQTANGLRSNPQIGTVIPDEWAIEFPSNLFPNVIKNISDVLFVITVQGKRG